MRKPVLLPLLACALAAAAPIEAHAYSTRVHIMIANEIREALIASGDGSIPLLHAPYAVQLSDEDFQAIRDHSLAFRGGAIGPDNMVFPGMTDPSHAILQRPYEQCELLYQEAIDGEERAYALGCFLHGATDAIAHHYVNHMSGETFTLTPITAAREQDFENVVRHILAEAMIQDSARDLDPEAFGTGALLHTIPAGFVLRAYLDESSPLWQLAAARPKEEYDAAKARNPDASLIELVSGLEVAPAEHLMLAPVYLAAIDEMIDDARADLEGRIAALQDHQSPDGAVLLVTPGPDGELGTDDDDTDCAASCPNLYATYFTYLALLAPRYDANQNELPSAFEKISTELRADLFEFLPRYLETIGNLSAKLNAPLVGESTGLDISKAELSLLFDPMKQWADDITTIDYDTLLYAVLPDWIIALDTFMQAANVDIALDGIVKAVFQPLLEPIKTAIQELIMAQAEQYIGAIVDELEAKKDEITGEYQDRLLAAAGMGLSGTALDHFYDSGLFVHAFNVTAATLANHAVVLPVGEDPIGVGPASFDASYTPAWMQAGVCDYLGDAIFPFGVDLRGLLTVDDGQRHEAAIAEDSPIECHQGALTMFADPATVASCVHVGLEGLKGDPAHVGSLTRAFPPELAEKPAECQNLVVPGLPDPPADPSTTDGDTTDGDTDGDTDGGTGSGDPGTGGGDSSDGSTTAGPLTGGTDSAGEDEGGGCGCSSQRDRGGAPLWLALLGLAFARRRRAGLAALALVSVGAGACGDDESSTDGSTAATTGDATTASTTAGSDPTTSTSESEGSSSDTDDPSTTDEPTTTDDPSTTDEPTTDPSTTEPDISGALLAALGDSVWTGTHEENGKLRRYELQFESDALLWGEIRNPFGPARRRTMRAFTVDPDGASVHSTIVQPLGWPVHPQNGEEEDWTFAITDGDPRVLEISHPGGTDLYTEGPAPTPTGGLTATVRVFEVGGVVDKAFCDSGGNGFEYKALFDFAHGQSDEIVADDVVAGVPLADWIDNTNNNQFSVTDVEGFERDGGTELSDSFNFFVTFEGAVTHPGGPLAVREANDSVEDALWVFLGDDVGSDNVGDLFLEVHGFIWPDNTPDEPEINLPAGDVPFEAILVRCTEQIKDVEVQMSLNGGPWGPVSEAVTTPLVNDELFPPVF